MNIQIKMEEITNSETDLDVNKNKKNGDLNPDQNYDEKRTLYSGVQFPSLLIRVKALIVDLMVILIIFSLSSTLIGMLGEPPVWVRGFIFIFSIYLYEPLFLTVFGGTIGHNLMKLTIRNLIRPKNKLNLLETTIRFITKYLLGWISFLTISGNNRKRAIHDMTCGSIVLFKKDWSKMH